MSYNKFMNNKIIKLDLYELLSKANYYITAENTKLFWEKCIYLLQMWINYYIFVYR
jgi:hypothetical protein